MIADSPAARTTALAGVLLVGGLTPMLVSGTSLNRDGNFSVSTPRDGAVITSASLFSWSMTAGASTYAVVVDERIPAPGESVRPGSHVLTVAGTSIRLTLGRSRTGSPSARSFHTVTVVPLDDAGRRIGSGAAVVHVRDRA